ncbi:cytochrome P450 71A23 [Citrus sinensis]|uniref:Cytochrome P450 n=2 Tax=Citrus TaxID=2706 RepID=V4T6I1_CITCL|nr:hypothetical protein CICLE_v10024607mg [Citrus x clementina]KAH9722797.1 cytochrome P450 71A23 [Citrus sinensis]
MEMLLFVSNNIVSRCVIGRKADEEEENIGKSNKYGELLRRLEEQLAAFYDLSGLIGRLNATARALDALLDQVIEEHINKVLSESDDVDDQSDKKDFVDILLHLWKNSMLGAELSQDNLEAIILDMFLGGTDTTETTLEWAMAELVKNPTSMKTVQEEIRSVAKGKLNIDMKDIEKMDSLKCVLKETLRLHPPAPLLVPREIAQCVKRRDMFLNNPVDCQGQDFQFIPFGAGRRGCPGMSFGLAAVEYVIANLLHCFDWKLPLGEVEENLGMTEVNGLTVHKKLPLYLVPALDVSRKMSIVVMF